MDTLSIHPTLLFMLKIPKTGYVKTRLAAEMGAQAACDAYRQIVEHLFEELAPYCSIEVHYTPGNKNARAAMENWLGTQHSYFPQPKGDLGRRMHSAVKGAFSRNAQSVVLLGGDCPYVDPTTIQKTAENLNSSDVVIGPALDGGYYLLGLNKPQPALFRNIVWGTETVFKTTLERAKKKKLTVHSLPPAEDVDDFPSWYRARTYLRQKETISENDNTVYDTELMC